MFDCESFQLRGLVASRLLGTNAMFKVIKRTNRVNDVFEFLVQRRSEFGFAYGDGKRGKLFALAKIKKLLVFESIENLLRFGKALLFYLLVSKIAIAIFDRFEERLLKIFIKTLHVRA